MLQTQDDERCFVSAQDNTTIPDKLISDLLADDPDMIDLVEEFVEALPSRIEELKQAYEQLDWDQLATLAHQLKGAGGSYGYPPLSSLGATMEQAFKQHSAEQFAEWLGQLEKLVAAAKAGLYAN